MNKADLINEVAKVVSTKKEAQGAVDCVLDSITKVSKGDAVTLVGFGTFKWSNARPARAQPQTGAEIKISASKAPKFVAGKCSGCGELTQLCPGGTLSPGGFCDVARSRRRGGGTVLPSLRLFFGLHPVPWPPSGSSGQRSSG
jgi:DNA-binding protein HU-beta